MQDKCLIKLLEFNHLQFQGDESCRDDIYREVEDMREKHTQLKDDLASAATKMFSAREDKAKCLSKLNERDRKKKELQKLKDEVLQIDADIEVGI